MFFFIYIKRGLNSREKQKEIYLNQNTNLVATLLVALQLIHYGNSVLYTLTLYTSAAKISASNSARECF